MPCDIGVSTRENRLWRTGQERDSSILAYGYAFERVIDVPSDTSGRSLRFSEPNTPFVPDREDKGEGWGKGGGGRNETMEKNAGLFQGSR